MHNPVNHPLRPVYRALAGLTGLYLLAFGILGAVLTAGDGLFAGESAQVFGQETNLAWCLLSAVAGIAVLVALALGRNLDVAVDTYVGWSLLVVGLAMMALMRTDANLFNFSMATVLVTFLAGLFLITAGLYSKVVPQSEAGAPRQVRQQQA